MLRTKTARMHAGKTLIQPGATPLWTASSRPKVCGVAPGRHPGTVTVFCPRAYRVVSESECGEVKLPKPRGDDVDVSFESTTQTA